MEFIAYFLISQEKIKREEKSLLRQMMKVKNLNLEAKDQLTRAAMIYMVVHFNLESYAN